MCFEVMKLYPPQKPLRLLDIACGEGKNAVFFARNGYNVTAFDAVGLALDKGRKLAEQVGVDVNFFQADFLDFRLDNDFDIIFCSGAMHYIPPELRQEIIGNYQEHTSVGGLHALNVFVRKPFVKSPSNKKTGVTNGYRVSCSHTMPTGLSAHARSVFLIVSAAMFRISIAWTQCTQSSRMRRNEYEKDNFRQSQGCL